MTTSISTAFIFGAGLIVSLFCVAFLAFSVSELKRLGKEYDQRQRRS